MKPIQNNNFQYITFRLAQNLIGVDILDIREIVPCNRVTKIHRAPGFVMGLMNLRGQILTILDIGVLMGFHKQGEIFCSHIIVFKHTNVGFAVEQIGDLFDIDNEKIESIPANIDPQIQKYTDTIINLQDGVMMILNAEKIIACTQTEIRPSKEDL